jgi:hypothetical protein
MVRVRKRGGGVSSENEGSWEGVVLGYYMLVLEMPLRVPRIFCSLQPVLFLLCVFLS